MMKYITKHWLAVIVVLFVATVLFTSCHSEKSKNIQQEGSNKETTTTVETFVSGDGWGYEIKIKGKTKIKQSYIPAIEGNLPFASETEARKVGELVLAKMRKKGKGLPAVTTQELDSLKIRY